MAKFVRPYMRRTGYELDGDIGQPVIDEKLGQNLSYLVGYCDTTEQYELVRLDDDGRLLVSSGSVKSNDGNISIVTPSDPSVLALSENPERKMFIIQNTGNETVYLGFTDTVDETTGFPLGVNTVWENDVWYGQIYAFALGATAEIVIIEMS